MPTTLISTSVPLSFRCHREDSVVANGLRWPSTWPRSVLNIVTPSSKAPAEAGTGAGLNDQNAQVKLQGMREAHPLPRTPMVGRFVINEMLVPKKHGPQLWEAFGGTGLNQYVRFMNWPHISSIGQFIAHISQMTKAEGSRSPLDKILSRPTASDIYAIVVDGKALGIRAYLSIDLRHRKVESGRVIKSTHLIGTLASLESTYLAMARVFDECGFRRWESETLVENIAARRSMEKYGCSFEGIARSAKQLNGKDCDLARYALIADDWPAAKVAMERRLYEAQAIFEQDQRVLSGHSDQPHDERLAH